MGFDPVTAGIGLMAGSSILGGMSQDKANKANAKSANAWQSQIASLAQGMMTPTSGGKYQTQLDDFIKSLNFTPTEGVTAGPAAQIDMSSITPNLNMGNDALMQVIRGGANMNPTAMDFLTRTIQSGGNPFDLSSTFDTLGKTDARNIDTQVNSLIAQNAGGGLGERFGTATMDRAARLRENLLADINSRNAGMASTEYNNAQGRAAGAAQLLSQDDLARLSTLINAGGTLNQGAINAGQLALTGAQANAGATNNMNQFNAGQTNNTNQFNTQQQQAFLQMIMQGILSSAGLGQQAGSQNAQLLSIMAGVPGGQQFASALPGSMGNIGQLLLLGNQLKK